MQDLGLRVLGEISGELKELHINLYDLCFGVVILMFGLQHS